MYIPLVGFGVHLTHLTTASHRTHLHRSRCIEVLIQRANAEKGAGQRFVQGRRDGTREFKSYHRSEFIQPTSRHRYSLKAIFTHCSVVVIKYDEACILGGEAERRTAAHDSVRQETHWSACVVLHSLPSP